MVCLVYHKLAMKISFFFSHYFLLFQLMLSIFIFSLSFAYFLCFSLFKQLDSLDHMNICPVFPAATFGI